MTNYERTVKKRLEAYTLPKAREELIQQTLVRGKEILQQHPIQEVAWPERLIQQIRYISPLFWITELLALGFALYVISKIDIHLVMTAVLSSLSFIVALVSILGFPELCKSYSHRMWELEQSCKNNLKQLIALKLLIIGSLDFLVLITLSLLMSLQTKVPLWKVAVYLFVPFNLTCILGFYVISLWRKREMASSFYLLGLSLAFFMLLLINRFSVYQQISFQLWQIFFTVSVVLLITRMRHFFKGVDERGGFLWS